MNNRNMIIAIAVIVVLLGLGAYLYTTNNSNNATNQDDAMVDQQPATQQDTNMQNEAAGDAGTQLENPDVEFTITGENFSFDPAELTVKEGDVVRITFVNADGMHDWKLDEFNAQTQVLQTGETETIQFIAETAGTYEYYCSVGNHREMGMVGNLIVE